MVVFAVVALVVTLVAAFIAFFLGQSLLASTHESATLSGPNVLRAVVGTALYVTLCGLFAFAAGAIMRHTAAAITSVIGLLFVIPILAHLLPSSWYNDLERWLPDAAGRAISATIGGQDSAPVLPVESVRRVRRLYGDPARRGRRPVPQARRLSAPSRGAPSYAGRAPATGASGSRSRPR